MAPADSVRLAYRRLTGELHQIGDEPECEELRQEVRALCTALEDLLDLLADEADTMELENDVVAASVATALANAERLRDRVSAQLGLLQGRRW